VTGNVLSEGESIGEGKLGGLVGGNGGDISYCYATGSVTGGKIL